MRCGRAGQSGDAAPFGVGNEFEQFCEVFDDSDFDFVQVFEERVECGQDMAFGESRAVQNRREFVQGTRQSAPNVKLTVFGQTLEALNQLCTPPPQVICTYTLAHPQPINRRDVPSHRSGPRVSATAGRLNAQKKVTS